MSVLSRWSRLLPAIAALMAMLISGTLIYHYLEGWSIIDSLYFTTVTVTTIGYGDFVPTTELSRMVTIFFALGGVSVSLYVLSIIGRIYYEEQEARLERMQGALKQARDTAVQKHGSRADVRVAARQDRSERFRSKKYRY